MSSFLFSFLSSLTRLFLQASSEELTHHLTQDLPLLQQAGLAFDIKLPPPYNKIPSFNSRASSDDMERWASRINRTLTNFILTTKEYRNLLKDPSTHYTDSDFHIALYKGAGNKRVFTVLRKEEFPTGLQLTTLIDKTHGGKRDTYTLHLGKFPSCFYMYY